MYQYSERPKDWEVASSIGDAERDLHSEFGEEVDDRWDDWEEDEAEAQCPFCVARVSPPTAAFDHCRTEHSFDFKRIRQTLGLDFYGSIRLINYVRTKTKEGEQIAEDAIVNCGKKASWLKDDALLVPVLEDDALLYAFEDEDDDDLTNALNKAVVAEVPPPPSASTANSATIADLQNRLQETTVRAQIAEMRLQEMTRAFEQYKELVKKTFLDDRAGGDPWAKKPEQKERVNGVNGEEKDPEWEMDYYFGSYAENEIHEQMLKDEVRTNSYKNFILNNKAYFKDKVVLDVGCGTGILSMFAATAGASQVYAVDNSTIINKARKIVVENGLADKITFVQGKVEEISLPVDNVDIIISEWMGYFLLYEGMLDSVLHARDRWLAPDGIMAPSRTDILIAAMDDHEWMDDKYHFWDDVYGFKMQTMKQGFLTDGNVDFADPKSIISDYATVKRIDTETTTVAALDFESPFHLTINREGRVNALCGWFDTFFEGEDEDGNALEKVFFSTGPAVKGTHWKQTMFAFEPSVDVVVGTWPDATLLWRGNGRKVKGFDASLLGSTIEGTFKCTKSEENHREIVIVADFVIKNPGGGEGVRVNRSFQVR
ncbi:Protein arginine N-methyltransferase 3 [Rhizophlyctis rosea]|nr:Protein arginine N-methyltransferase 3 [Rhizophlyctis rosea]